MLASWEKISSTSGSLACYFSQVSENKRRYQKDGFDLDLTYVTGSCLLKLTNLLKMTPFKKWTFVCIFTNFVRPSHRHVFPLLWEAVILQESDQGKSYSTWVGYILTKWAYRHHSLASNLITRNNFKMNPFTGTIVTMNFQHKVDPPSHFVQEVARFLDTKHEGHYKVYNLCSKLWPPFITCTTFLFM